MSQRSSSYCVSSFTRQDFFAESHVCDGRFTGFFQSCSNIRPFARCSGSEAGLPGRSGPSVRAFLSSAAAFTSDSGVEAGENRSKSISLANHSWMSLFL